MIFFIAISLKFKLPCKAFKVCEDVIPPFQSHWQWLPCSHYPCNNTQLWWSTSFYRSLHTMLSYRNIIPTPVFRIMICPLPALGSPHSLLPNRVTTSFYTSTVLCSHFHLKNLFNWVIMASLHINPHPLEWKLPRAWSNV